MLKAIFSRERALHLSLLWLRVVPSLVMITAHGWPKLMRVERLWERFPDPLGIGSSASLVCALGAEVGCAALIIVGLYTRFAAIPLAFTMGVAAFMVHGDDPWSKKELAVIYMVVFLALALTGAGRYSLDDWRAKRRLRKVQK